MSNNSFVYNQIKYSGIGNRGNNRRSNSPQRRGASPIRNISPPRAVSPKLLNQHRQESNEDDFQKKIDELYKFANINNLENNRIDPSVFSVSENNVFSSNKVSENNVLENYIKNNSKIKNQNIDSGSRTKENIVYGIKKTILSDFNSLYTSSNSNDLKIGVNKNINQNRTIYDCFYLFPNISEINTKNETNIINEKKVDYFENKIEHYDIQYFPIDFIPCGINIPMKTSEIKYGKLVIKNIFWNIFQSINVDNYRDNELLCTVPEKNDYIYKKIQLYLHFELHSQITNSKLLPYKNDKHKNPTPANSCLYKSIPIEIGTLNGSYFNSIEINLSKDIDISCALLCLKVSVPDCCSEILKGFDKYSKLYHGFIPFSQFIVSLDYEIV